jgi:uncharacterized protein
VFSLEQDLLRLEWYPAPSDAVYLASYAVIAAGLLHLVRGRQNRSDPTPLLDAAIVAVGFGIVVGTFLIAPIAADSSLSVAGRLAASGYPVADVLVITPYNGQVGRLRHTLDDAGLVDVSVGTVDKFQGQEAPVAILSMAASSHSDVSRGMGFLLNRHRLNVAVSRGKHSAFVVRSEVLTDFAPRTPDELVALGAFLGLCENAVTTASVAPREALTGASA